MWKKKRKRKEYKIKPSLSLTCELDWREIGARGSLERDRDRYEITIVRQIGKEIHKKSKEEKRKRGEITDRYGSGDLLVIDGGVATT